MLAGEIGGQFLSAANLIYELSRTWKSVVTLQIQKYFEFLKFWKLEL